MQKGRDMDVAECLKNPVSQDIYIPGSSVKGALRTAFAYHVLRSDEELFQQFKRSGSLDTLGELYSRYMHLVFGVSLKYLESRDEAKDAVMQIFEKLVVELPGQEIRKFKSWLYVLTKNHCLMYIRSQKTAAGRLEGYKIEQEFMESDEDLHPIDKQEQSV